MNMIRARLGLKLFASYFLVILIGMASIWIATRFTTPRAFDRHLYFMEQQLGMGSMMAQPGSTGQGQGFGQGLGQGQGRMIADFYANFQESFNESLILSVIIATAVALSASIIFSRNIVAPVQALTQASQRLAEGRYEERVPSRGSDELGQLAKSFNQMAEQ